MGRNSTKSDRKSPADTRQERLKSALKANLKRRKAQARNRKTPSANGAQKKD